MIVTVLFTALRTDASKLLNARGITRSNASISGCIAEEVINNPTASGLLGMDPSQRIKAEEAFRVEEKDE
jgi:hypothetical protein